MTRLLVTGDRNWKDRDYLFSILDDIMLYYGITHLIEGCARGADRLSEEWATTRNVSISHFPAEWDKYNKAAGPIRNRQMLKEGKPDMVVAFHKSLNTSKGTKDMVLASRKEGLPVHVFPSYGE